MKITYVQFDPVSPASSSPSPLPSLQPSTRAEDCSFSDSLTSTLHQYAEGMITMKSLTPAMFRISSYSEELHQKLCSFAQTTGVLNHQVQLKSCYLNIYGHHIIHVCHCHMCHIMQK